MSERILKMVLNTKYGKSERKDESYKSNVYYGVQAGLFNLEYHIIFTLMDKNEVFWCLRTKNEYSSNLISNIKISKEKNCPYFHNPYKIYSQYNGIAKGYCEKECCFIYENDCCKNMKNCQLFYESDFLVNGILL